MTSRSWTARESAPSDVWRGHDLYLHHVYDVGRLVGVSHDFVDKLVAYEGMDPLDLTTRHVLAVRAVSVKRQVSIADGCGGLNHSGKLLVSIVKRSKGTRDTGVVTGSVKTASTNTDLS
jgi:hypothetical protein